MTMLQVKQIKELTKNLTAEEKKELVAELLATLNEEAPVAVTKHPRILGLHAHLGEGWMSDDFRDELPDSFWLGKA